MKRLVDALKSGSAKMFAHAPKKSIALAKEMANAVQNPNVQSVVINSTVTHTTIQINAADGRAISEAIAAIQTGLRGQTWDDFAAAELADDVIMEHVAARALPEWPARTGTDAGALPWVGTSLTAYRLDDKWYGQLDGNQGLLRLYRSSQASVLCDMANGHRYHWRGEILLSKAGAPDAIVLEHLSPLGPLRLT